MDGGKDKKSKESLVVVEKPADKKDKPQENAEVANIDLVKALFSEKEPVK